MAAEFEPTYTLTVTTVHRGWTEPEVRAWAQKINTTPDMVLHFTPERYGLMMTGNNVVIASTGDGETRAKADIDTE